VITSSKIAGLSDAQFTNILINLQIIFSFLFTALQTTKPHRHGLDLVHQRMGVRQRRNGAAVVL